MKNILLTFSVLIFFNKNFAQGTFTGNFRMNLDLYDNDTSINTQGKNYTQNKSSSNTWMQLYYNNNDIGLEGGIRMDMYNNSLLQNPVLPTTYNGIGNWFIKKKIDNIEITGGYIYEQFGSGIALRAFEERSLGIDNSIFGAKINYQYNDNISLKAIAGVQKFQLGYINSFIKGANVEFIKPINENLLFLGGLAVVNRTLGSDYRSLIDAEIKSYPTNNIFEAPFNNVIYNFYNTLNYKEFTFSFDGAYKSKEATYNLLEKKYVNKAGTNMLVSLSYSKSKLGVNLQAKHTDFFQAMANSEQYISTTPDQNKLVNSRFGYLSPINKQHSLRLPARFQVSPQDNGELGLSLDVTYKLHPKISVALSACTIDTTLNTEGKGLSNSFSTNPYYRELFLEFDFTKLLDNRLNCSFGGQYVFYNQKVMVEPSGVNDAISYTGFIEASYKLSKMKSIRTEFQYQHALKDLGQTIFALLEYNIAPNWTFAVSDLYTFKPNEKYFLAENTKSHHYYSIFSSYTKGTTRFQLGYTKQMAGIVCTGGLCRLEPAFSGIRAQITTSF